MSARKFLFQQAKRDYRNMNYDDMARSMQHLASLKIDLTHRERLLFSQVVRRTIRLRRDRIKQLKADHKVNFEGTKDEQQQEEEDDSNQSGDGAEHVVSKKLNSITAKLKELKIVTREYRNAIDRLLFTVVEDLLPNAESLENLVFLHKTNADLHCYLAEMAKGKIRDKFINIAIDAYKQASEIALDNLDPTNPTRLSLMLNHAVFHYEVLGSPKKAIAIADSTVDYVNYADDHPDFLGNVYLGILNKNRAAWAQELAKNPQECDDPEFDLMAQSEEAIDLHLELAALEALDALRLHFPENSTEMLCQKVKEVLMQRRMNGTDKR